MAVDCSRDALSFVSRSQTTRICHLLLNLESCSGVSSFAAVAMSGLQLAREVIVELSIDENASEQERTETCIEKFSETWGPPVGDVRCTSLSSNKVLLEGQIVQTYITDVVVTCAYSGSINRSTCEKMVYEYFQEQHGHLGDSVSGLTIDNEGNQYKCRGQFRVSRPRECRLVLNLVEISAPAALPDGEEGEDGEDDNDAVENLDEDDDNSSINLKRCDFCNSTGPAGLKCDGGYDCDSENGGWYVNDISSDDDSDDSSQWQQGRCSVCGTTGPQGLKCEIGEDCNEDTGGYFSERV